MNFASPTTPPRFTPCNALSCHCHPLCVVDGSSAKRRRAVLHSALSPPTAELWCLPNPRLECQLAFQKPSLEYTLTQLSYCPKPPSAITWHTGKRLAAWESFHYHRVVDCHWSTGFRYVRLKMFQGGLRQCGHREKNDHHHIDNRLQLRTVRKVWACVPSPSFPLDSFPSRWGYHCPMVAWRSEARDHCQFRTHGTF